MATHEERFPLNNNRNNRRRGRGNRNQNGSGNQLNRIDSRARGNAPQMLDKYKKLAQDAQHNGDRVQAEYYLQFADHYFRVLADNKARQDEARGKRSDNRSDSRSDNRNDDGQDDGDGRYDDGGESDRGNENRRTSPNRQRSRRDDDDDSDYYADHGSDRDGDDAESENTRSDEDIAEEAPKRRIRKPKSETPRKAETPRKSETPRKARRARKPDDDDVAAAIDSSVLPPSITRSRAISDSAEDSGGDDTLEAVS